MDNGPLFRAKLFLANIKMLGMEPLITTVYHSTTNGQVKRFINTIAQGRSTTSLTIRGTRTQMRAPSPTHTPSRFTAPRGLLHLLRCCHMPCRVRSFIRMPRRTPRMTTKRYWIPNRNVTCNGATSMHYTSQKIRYERRYKDDLDLEIREGANLR